MSGFEGGGAGGEDYLTSKPFLEAKAYINSKGMPLTAENVRRFMAMKAANPTIAAPTATVAAPTSLARPPDSQGGAAPTSNQRGSAPDGLAQRMHQSAPSQPQPQPQSQQPNAASDSAMGAPTAQPAAGGGSGILSQIAQMILGGGAGAGLAHLFMGSRGNPSPIPQLGIPIPGGNPQLGSSQPQIGQSPLGLPAPQPTPQSPLQLPGSQMPQVPQSQPQVGGPGSPPLISDKNLVGGDLQPIGPPQPGRMQPGPSSPIPLPQAPPGAAPASNVASGAPVSILPRELGGDAADLGGHMDWGKILGDIGHVIGRR